MSTTTEHKLNVFISYSRADLDFADQLDAALDLTGFESTMDRQGISGGEEWQSRLGHLIRDADTVVFVVSPDSASSKVCAWEVEEAARQSKRIIPVCCRPLGGESAPPQLAQLNYIFFYAEPKAPGSGFGSGLAKLVDALSVDREWIREHTRLLQRAGEWVDGGKPANRLLSGADIVAAKSWAARRPKNAPELTPLHLDFLRASEDEEVARSNIERKKLEEFAAAQTERSKALTAAEEALKQAAEAQRRRSLIRNVALAAVTSVAIVAAWQWKRAEDGRTGITDLLNKSQELVANISSRYTFKKEDYDLALGLFQRGADLGDPSAMYMLGAAFENGYTGNADQAKAIELYQKAAGKDYPLALYWLATRYAEGDGVPKDPDKARTLFERAADKADADTLYQLAQRYETGNGVSNNMTRAWDLYQRSAGRGSVEAMLWLAKSYFEGTGVQEDAGKGREQLEKAAAAGSLEAMQELAGRYDTGNGVQQSSDKSREWLTKAAETGDVQAMRKLAIIYEAGNGVDRDGAKALEWFEKVIEKEGAAAATDIGILYDYGQQGVPKDTAKARKWYERAVDANDTRAMTYLAYIIGQGSDGTPADPGEANQLYEKSAALGDAFAMLVLGIRHEWGLGVAADKKKALDWYQRAAKNENTQAMINIALLYQSGAKDIAKNPTEARKWLDLAAEKGDNNALARIGDLFEQDKNYGEARTWYQKALDAGGGYGAMGLGQLAYAGRGEPRNYERALSMWEKGAEMGNLESVFALGVLHEHGQGVPRDYGKAREYFESAATDGAPGAFTALAEMYSKGYGVPQDVPKARELLRRADLLGDAFAKWNAEMLEIDELQRGGDCSRAFSRQQELTARTKTEELEKLGKLDDQTDFNTDREVRLAILCKEFDKAQQLAKEAAGQLGAEHVPHIQLAHALMFLDKPDEAKAIYLAHRGEQVPGKDHVDWERAVADDFELFRSNGLQHPMMAEVEKTLGIANQ